MDKTLTRKIGYVPQKPAGNGLPVTARNKNAPKSILKPVAVVRANPAKTIKERSKALFKWLKGRPLISISGLCTLVGTDQSNFQKCLKGGKDLKEPLLNKFISELKSYGYSE